ncbi:hypothetical protein PC128_g1608 [Phytophthora cactorum]|nr:hypothetical protein PC128_g1608 [Phytophthora cactorum]
MSNLTAESIVILLLDPRTKFSIEALVRLRKPAATTDLDNTNTSSATDANMFSATENIYLAEIDAVIEEDWRMLRDAHRDVFRAMYSGAQDASVRATTEMPPYLYLVPSIDDNGILCGALVAMSDVRERPLRCRHDDVDEVLAKSLNHGCKWPCSRHWAIS